MSKGTEVIAVLQQYFGQRVDPVGALSMLFAKINSQNEIIGRLKNLACAMAFDHGTLEAALEAAPFDPRDLGTGYSDLIALLALPRAELRAEVVEPNQPPSRIIT